MAAPSWSDSSIVGRANPLDSCYITGREQRVPSFLPAGLSELVGFWVGSSPRHHWQRSTSPAEAATAGEVRSPRTFSTTRRCGRRASTARATCSQRPDRASGLSPARRPATETSLTGEARREDTHPRNVGAVDRRDVAQVRHAGPVAGQDRGRAGFGLGVPGDGASEYGQDPEVEAAVPAAQAADQRPGAGGSVGRRHRRGLRTQIPRPRQMLVLVGPGDQGNLASGLAELGGCAADVVDRAGVRLCGPDGVLRRGGQGGEEGELGAHFVDQGAEVGDLAAERNGVRQLGGCYVGKPVCLVPQGVGVCGEGGGCGGGHEELRRCWRMAGRRTPPGCEGADGLGSGPGRAAGCAGLRARAAFTRAPWSSTGRGCGTGGEVAVRQRARTSSRGPRACSAWPISCPGARRRSSAWAAICCAAPTAARVREERRSCSPSHSADPAAPSRSTGSSCSSVSVPSVSRPRRWTSHSVVTGSIGSPRWWSAPRQR